MTHYQQGYKFEADFIKGLRADPNVLMADRFLKSIGPVWGFDYENLDRWGNYKRRHAPIDIWWLTKDGMSHYAQLKKGDYGVQTPEMLDLIMFADYCGGCAEVYLISKKGKKVHTWKIGHIY